MAEKYIMNSKFSQENIIFNDIYELNKLVFLDFEASSADEGGFPIEVGAISLTMDKKYESMINILDISDTITWSKDSENIHGIPLGSLDKGKSIELITNDLNHTFKGMVVLVDSPFHDTYWMRKLYEAAGKDLEYKVLTVFEFLYDIDMYSLSDLFINYKNESYSHRAYEDALYFRKRFIEIVLKSNDIVFSK